MLSSLTVIYVDIINHLPACVNVGSIISRMAKPDQTSSSSPNGLERFLVMALLVCVTAKRNGEKERGEMYFSIRFCIHYYYAVYRIDPLDL